MLEADNIPEVSEAAFRDELSPDLKAQRAVAKLKRAADKAARVAKSKAKGNVAAQKVETTNAAIALKKKAGTFRPVTTVVSLPDLTEDELAIEREGDAAGERLSSTRQWADWIAVGKLLKLARDEALIAEMNAKAKAEPLLTEIEREAVAA